MGKAIEVTRVTLSASELRALAAGTRDGAVVRRLLAIALILDGHSRSEAARLSPGRPGALNEAQMEALRTMVLEGPNPERNQVIRWRCADLRDEIAARWSIELHERSVGRLLHQLNMTRLQPRPHHPQKDIAAQEAYKKNPLPSSRSLAGIGGWQTNRNMVPDAMGVDAVETERCPISSTGVPRVNDH